MRSAGTKLVGNVAKKWTFVKETPTRTSISSCTASGSSSTSTSSQNPRVRLPPQILLPRCTNVYSAPHSCRNYSAFVHRNFISYNRSTTHHVPFLQELPQQTNQTTFVRWESTEKGKEKEKEEEKEESQPHRAPHRGKGSLIDTLTRSIKEELQKNKDLQENLEKLKQERSKLEQSDAIQEARKKFEIIEKERLRASQVIAQKVEDLAKQMGKVIEEAKKSEYGKKTLEATREAAESLEKAAKAAGDTAVYKTVATGMHVVKEEIDDITVKHAGMYARPEELKTRADYFESSHMSRTYEPNTDATSVELHKEARWYKSFKSWTDSNPAVNKILDWKIKYDESDNPAVRVARFFTDKVTSLFTGSSDISEALTEITKVDPEFDKEEFVNFCAKVIIPNVLEGMVRGDLPVLKDWCHEIVYRQLSTPITAAQQIGYKYKSRILDISRIELLAGKMMEQGPVLIIQFNAHQIEAISNSEGKIVEGNIDKPIKVMHVWALCRDLEELNPMAAWKVLEIHMQPQGEFLV